MKESLHKHNKSFYNLICNYNLGRYFEDTDLPKEKTREYFYNYVLKYVDSKRYGKFYTFNEDNEIDGFLIFNISEWDSNHFERVTCIINYIIVYNYDYELKKKKTEELLKKFEHFCKENKVKIIFVKIPSLDLSVIHVLEKNNFKFIESWIYNKFNLDKLEENCSTNLILRKSKENDLNYMLLFSENAFSTQRFHADKHINHNKAEELYRKWIRTAFNDESQNILVYEINSKPIAFMIYFINDMEKPFNLKFAMWKMALIDPEMRGKKIGLKFFKSLLFYHKQEGLDVVDSGLSLRNLASLNLHNKIGFKVIFTQVTLHKWL